MTVLGPEEHHAAVAAQDATARRRLVSVGVPLPGIELEIRGDDGAPLPPGERGEIHVRGEQVSGEYEDRGSVVDADGWFPPATPGSRTPRATSSSTGAPTT